MINKDRTVKVTVPLTLAVSMTILVMALVVYANAMASTVPTETLNSTTTQAPNVLSIGENEPPGCYTGSLDPFTIVQVTCMTNLQPFDSPLEPTLTGNMVSLGAFPLVGLLIPTFTTSDEDKNSARRHNSIAEAR